MASLELPYCKINASGSACNCDESCLNVNLSLGDKDITLEAMVDSGCTMTLVESSVAEVLGIDLSTCTTAPVSGICGETVGYMYSIDFFSNINIKM